MTPPNANILWSETVVDELVKNGVKEVCISPGSRSTPLTYSFSQHPEVRVYSHLDERSSAFFALGRGKATQRPTPLVCTSGTAAANFHPAVIEADESRVPLLVLTADRPPELRDTAANQTIDQEKLYGDSVRWYKDVAEPEADDRKLRSLRVTVSRAVSESTTAESGPVHLNFPFRKPLEPTEVEDEVPPGFESRAGAEGRDTSYVETSHGHRKLDTEDLRDIADTVESASSGLLVVGPSDTLDPEAVERFADSVGFAVAADPLSGVRFSSDVNVLGGYDTHIDLIEPPEVVVRLGDAPTSKRLKNYLRDSDADQIIVNSAGEYTDARFTTQSLVVADPNFFCREIAEKVERSPGDWERRIRENESEYWDAFSSRHGYFEGGILHEVARLVPDSSTVFVSNSMPVRDLDRYGEPRDANVDIFGNRGASGIDGITSTALGVGSAVDGELVLVTGDLAYYHDTNGLLAVKRCDVDVTVVEINNDGGGIFHMLPIEEYDPPFTQQFKTPHGLDFEHTTDLYGLGFERVDDLDSFRDAFTRSVSSDGSCVIEAVTDSEASHRRREEVTTEIRDELG
ncbi:2-succinyl-5-enolpyruvyl-6-hydroxy-3-cyclohexene-1-carboxylic-acid synthase [Halorutilales archaeon Cl-col2-1]